MTPPARAWVLQHFGRLPDDGLLRSSEAGGLFQSSETRGPPTVACPPPPQRGEQGIERQTETSAAEARHHGGQETASADWARQVSEVGET